ncbi:MAG TPA: hypothetical protein VMB25_16450 [Bryobacteraceae bacterium]|nr:hypothetical protein [Bryobacteraceae bacterium]
MVISTLCAITGLRADSVLPTETLSCSGESCSGSATQLASANGVQGVEIDFSGSSDDSASSTFEYDIAGLLSGDSLPAGSLISFTYSFTAESDNVDDTQIISDSFVVPPFAAFDVVSQTETIDGDGSCVPDPPNFPSWCRSVEGSGVLEFPSGLASGAPLDLGAEVTIDTDNGGGEPTISISGSVDFTAAVPEPRGDWTMPAGALIAIAWLGRRTAWIRTA